MYHKNNLSSIFVATEPYVSSSSESVGSVIVNESRGGGDHLPGRRSKQVRSDATAADFMLGCAPPPPEYFHIQKLRVF